MKKDYTHITFILDRSGSMHSCWNDVRGGYSEFVKEQKKGMGTCSLSLIAFDNLYDSPIKACDIQLVTENIDELNVGPRGGTALYDAIGCAIVETGEALDKLIESDKPEKVIFVIQTDGQENASREYNAKQVKELIKHQEEKYNWKFIFLGADKEACVSATRDLGMSVNSVANHTYAKTGLAINTINTKLLRAREAKTDQQYMSAVTYSVEELQEMS